jgi:hypothetical protein
MLPSSLSSYQRAARAVGAKSAGALALGAGALVLAPNDASATVTVFTPTSGNTASIGSDGDHLYVWFNFITGQVSNSPAFSGSQGYIYAQTDRSYITQSNNFGVAVNGLGYAKPLSEGATINGNDFYFRGFFHKLTGVPSADWNNVTGFIGVRVATTGGFFYGWANVTTDTNATTITLNSFGMSDVVNGSITAGEGLSAIPEPASSAALLAAGAAGLALYRKRKHLQRAA